MTIPCSVQDPDAHSLANADTHPHAAFAEAHANEDTAGP